ncbi:MAG: GGDEF domain-containing protein [Lachnospiraceae bacterium]|nr:GGDEF domain-containing protein [Lachnospiraceae bacterium]
MAKEKKPKVGKEKEKKVKYTGKASYDLGTILVFCAFAIASIVTSSCGRELYKENITMVAVAFTVAILAAFRVINAAMILAALQTVIFIGLKIASIASGTLEYKISFGWVAVPGLLVLGYTFINRAKREANLAQEIMNEQINELIMTDPVTGLYNLRSMYMDIQTQISYAERNNKQICLMILMPKYVDEMKAVLKPKEFKEVVIRLSKAVCDTVRLEDRVYSIDSEGGFGIILTCDREGARLVEDRLSERLSDADMYSDIVAGNEIRVEMQLGCVQYDEKLERDAIKFKDQTQAALKDLKYITAKEEETPSEDASDGEIEEIIEETVEEEPGDNSPRRVVTRKVITRRVVKKEAGSETANNGNAEG